MTLINSASAEFKRSPITVVTGAIGVLVAALSLILAIIQYQVTPEVSENISSKLTIQPLEVNLGNILVVVSYFLSLTIVSALIIRKIAKNHGAVAFFASIPLAALTNFSAVLVLYLVPPRALNQQLFISAHDLILYASAAIYVSVCGFALLLDLASTKPNQEDGEGLALLVVPLIILFIWCWLVFAGQTRITQTLLPEITHYIEKSKSSNGT